MKKDTLIDRLEDVLRGVKFTDAKEALEILLGAVNKRLEAQPEKKQPELSIDNFFDSLED